MGATIFLAGIVAELDGLLGGTIAASAALLEKATNFPRHLCANIPATGERLVITPIFDYPGVPPKVFHIVVLGGARMDARGWSGCLPISKSIVRRPLSTVRCETNLAI
jgi:hypothetical protein